MKLDSIERRIYDNFFQAALTGILYGRAIDSLRESSFQDEVVDLAEQIADKSVNKFYPEFKNDGGKKAD